MPIYVFVCGKCGAEIERFQQKEEGIPMCCGEEMVKQMTFPAMVKVKGEGGYPSRRKFYKGTAPFTTNATKPWVDTDPYEPVKQKEGRKWLASQEKDIEGYTPPKRPYET